MKMTCFGKEKPEKESLAQAKGKMGKSYANALFSKVDDMFYEFGLLTKPRMTDKQKEEDN